MGADTICIKDMANLLLPYDAYSLVKQLKERRGCAHPSAYPQYHRHRRHDLSDGGCRRAWTSWIALCPPWPTVLPSPLQSLWWRP